MHGTVDRSAENSRDVPSGAVDDALAKAMVDVSCRCGGLGLFTNDGGNRWYCGRCWPKVAFGLVR
jgi:ribosomal protein S27AE